MIFDNNCLKQIDNMMILVGGERVVVNVFEFSHLM
jgi:hypothetical protein